MTVTYSGDPANNSRDAVRFLIQDTSTSTGRLQDAEIDWILSKQSNVFLAAAEAARTLASRYATQPQSKTVDGLTITYGDLTERYRKLSAEFTSRASKGGLTIPVYAGGISASDKETQASDTDWEKPWAYLGIHDYPHADIFRRDLTSTST